MNSLQIWRAATNISNWKYGIPIVFKLHRLETISQTHNIHFAHHNCKYRLPQLSHHQAAQSIIKRNYLHESYGQVLSLTKDAGHKRSQTKEVFLKHAAHLCDWCAWYKNCNQLPHIHTHICCTCSNNVHHYEPIHHRLPPSHTQYTILHFHQPPNQNLSKSQHRSPTHWLICYILLTHPMCFRTSIAV